MSGTAENTKPLAESMTVQIPGSNTSEIYIRKQSFWEGLKVGLAAGLAKPAWGQLSATPSFTV